MNNTNFEVGKTIINQLGGYKFCVMTGAKNFLFTNKSVEFSIMKCFQEINKVRVILEATDLYRIEFIKKYADTEKIIKIASGIFNCSLVEVFEKITKLYTKLF